jgi:8-oxo-dGTP diphosphatase
MSLSLEHRNKKVYDIHEGKWNGLAGKFEAEETPEECVIREILRNQAYLFKIQNYADC